MYSKLIIFILTCLDYFNKKKIINFFDKIFHQKLNILIDVGSHHGETIRLFNRYFNINKIFGFEASPINFNRLVQLSKKIEKKNFEIFNKAVSYDQKFATIQHFSETSSSTIVKINKESDYFIKKKKILSIFKEYKPEANFEVECIKLENFINFQKIELIDIIKVDTEGYDYNVIKSLGLKINNVKAIYFEHHFHNMFNKNYTLSEIHDFLVKNNFRKALKLKMFFRKTFEYIYLNKKFYE